MNIEEVGHVEDLILKIWMDVLDTDDILPADDFASLGGDSLAAMQVMIRARNAGLVIDAADMRTHYTVAELAGAVIQRRPTPAETTAPIDGMRDGPLLPRQTRFFNWKISDPNRYSLEYLLELVEPLDVAAIERATRALGQQFGTLGVHFGRRGDRYVQVPASLELSLRVAHLELDDSSTTSARKALEGHLNELRSSLDIWNGPLWRVTYLTTQNQGSWLHILVHHLLVDGVSLVMLAEQFQNRYHEATRTSGDPRALDPEEASSQASRYLQHARSLSALADAPSLSHDLSEWHRLPWAEVAPVRGKRVGASLDFSHLRLVRRKLEPAESRAVLRCRSKSTVTTEELILASLARGLGAVNETSVVAMNVVRNGRQAESSDAGADAELGWFSTLSPYVLVMLPGEGVKVQLDSLVHQIRRIRRLEQSWTVARYLSENTEVTQDLARLPIPDVYVNYRGNLGNQIWRPPFVERISAGLNMPDGGEQQFPIHIYGDVDDGTVELSFSFSQAMFDASVIENLADRAATSLIRYVDQIYDDTSVGTTHRV